MQRSLPVLLSSILLASCLAPTEPGAARAPIIDGREASPSDVSATVALVQDGYPACTGTLVTPRVVITAAHCVRESSDGFTFGPVIAPTDVTVVAGAIDAITATPDQRYEVALVWADDAFPGDAGETATGMTDEHDIAALVLSHDVVGMVPAPVLDPSQLDLELTRNRMMEIAGYGTTDRAGYGENTRLHVGSLPFVERSERELTGGVPNGVDTCYGDSGGPAYVDTARGRRLVGVTSRGVDPFSDACDSGTVFTLAPAFAAVLAEVVGEPVVGAGPGGRPPPGDPGAEPAPGHATPSDPGSAPGAPGELSEGDPKKLTGGCSVAPSSPRDARVSLLVLVLLAVAGWDRARRRRSGSSAVRAA